MSSDESDEEEGSVIYRVKTLPWRRDIRAHLDYIDKRRYDGGAYSHSGAKPRMRSRRRYIESKRGPVLELPRSFYDEGWMCIDSDEQASVALATPDEDFEWPDVRIRP